MATRYPEDEFDRMAAERNTVGAHRQPPNARPWIIGVIAVLVLAPLLGIGLGKWLAGSDEPTSQPSTSASAPAEQTTTPTPSPAEETSPAPATQEAPKNEPTPSAQPPVVAEPNLGQRILVLNGRGTNGLAGQKAAVLKRAGFGNLNVADYKGGADPVETTVFYASPEFAGTARLAAEKLGIARVVESAEVASKHRTQVVIVLR